MQIITTEQVLELVLLQSHELAQQLFGVILNAVGENITLFGIAAWGDVVTGNWSSSNVLVFLGSIFLGLSLVKNNIIDAVEYVGSKL